MITALSIRDVVLIERLDLEFSIGLSVLTGETGAGKSIVLDALGLALGARSEKGLVREGERFGSVTACFEPHAEHSVFDLLGEQGIATSEAVVLRRVVQPDGRSRAFINDEPVGVNLLRRIGHALVEIHGQMDQHGLMDTKTHAQILDRFADNGRLAAELAIAHHAVREAAASLKESINQAEQRHGEADYLQHRLDELEALAPEEGEVDRLGEQRQMLQQREKFMAVVRDATEIMSGVDGAASILARVERLIDRAPDAVREGLAPALQAIERAIIEAQEAEALLGSAASDMDMAEHDLERIEDRLFTLRDAARKYRVDADQLPQLLAQTATALEELREPQGRVDTCRKALEACRGQYDGVAERLGRLRRKAAKELAQSVKAELPPLKLERARFRVHFDELEGEQAGARGRELAVFQVSTNPGQGYAPIGKVASGGELSRLMLAFKVVLSRSQTTHSMVFDEVDSGIGGATAAAVGDRLARLAENQQVLVVTHAPQVAARATHHLHVAKAVKKGRTSVEVHALGEDERLEELARMLSGNVVTTEAKAAAAQLIEAAA